ncbi:MAG: C45 family peptidase [Anaerolineae bacterium]|nr:C45 family peptidase [Anaerolineae bacterium]
MTLPILNLHGTPFEQGLLHGRQLRDAILHNVALYRERFWLESHIAWPDILDRAARYLQAIEIQNANYAAGMAGIAAGSGVDLNVIAALNVRYEILYHEFSVIHGADGCTAFVIEPSRSADNQLYFAQNWDWIPDTACAVVRTTDTNGHVTLVFTEAGIFGGKIGINNAGLGLMINGLNSTTDNWASLEKPFHVRCYEILQQQTFDDAVAVITDTRRACSANYIIGHRDGQVVNLETAPDAIRATHCRNGCLVHTNHFIDPESMGIQVVRRVGSFTVHRLNRAETLINGNRRISQADIEAILSDHDGYPNAVCQHRDPNDPPHEWVVTVSSLILNLTRGMLYATDGTPCTHPFAAIAL